MLRRLTVPLLFLIVTAPTLAASPLVRSQPTAYSLRLGAVINYTRMPIRYLACALPVPESNEYQDVTLRQYSDGALRGYPENGEAFLYAVLIQNRMVGGGILRGDSESTFHYDCDITLYAVDTDFSSLPSVPYLQSTPLYKRYTAPNGDYIVPRHPRIARMARELESRGESPVEFARKAYLHVAKTFKYLGGEGKMTPLDAIFDKNGGASADLSTLFISLLRYKGIPARHVVARKPNGGHHVFAEFYVEKAGWIPVDVTLRARRPSGDFFGRIAAEDRAIVLSRDILLTLPWEEKSKPTPMMNRYAFTSRIETLTGGGKNRSMRNKEIFSCNRK